MVLIVFVLLLVVVVLRENNFLTVKGHAYFRIKRYDKEKACVFAE